MLLRIYNDDTPLVDHTQLKRQEKERREAAEANDSTDLNGAPQESFYDSEDGGVKLNAAVDEDIENADATAPIGASGVGREEDAMAAEDRLRAEQQRVADEQQVVDAAPEREGESDAMNTTV